MRNLNLYKFENLDNIKLYGPYPGPTGPKPGPRPGPYPRPNPGPRPRPYTTKKIKLLVYAK